MIDWLCDPFGFERHLVVEDANDEIAHAEFISGDAMIMLGSDLSSDFGRLMAMTSEIGARETQTAYMVVPDADARHPRAGRGEKPALPPGRSALQWR